MKFSSTIPALWALTVRALPRVPDTAATSAVSIVPDRPHGQGFLGPAIGPSSIIHAGRKNRQHLIPGVNTVTLHHHVVTVTIPDGGPETTITPSSYTETMVTSSPYTATIAIPEIHHTDYPTIPDGSETTITPSPYSDGPETTITPPSYTDPIITPTFYTDFPTTHLTLPYSIPTPVSAVAGAAVVHARQAPPSTPWNVWCSSDGGLSMDEDLTTKCIGGVDKGEMWTYCGVGGGFHTSDKSCWERCECRCATCTLPGQPTSTQVVMESTKVVVLPTYTYM